jgi:adenylate kinase family enzyme
VYSLAVRPPKVAGVCDRCGGPVSATARSDESPEVVKKRLEIYDNETKPVIDYFEKRGVASARLGRRHDGRDRRAPLGAPRATKSERDK